MKKTKDLFLVTSLVCILSTLLNIFYAIDAVINLQIFNAVMYVVFCIAGIASVVAFIFFRKQTDEFLLTHKNWVMVFCVASLVCSLLGGIIAFYAYYIMTINVQQNANYPQYEQNSTTINGVEVINDKNMANYIDKLNRLEELKNSGTITNEQYNALKQQAINEYLNKGE